MFTQLAFFLWVAAVIQVNYLDSYEILTNALALSGQPAPTFPLRTVFSNLLQLPFVWTEAQIGLSGFAFRASYFLSVVFYAGVLWLYFRLARTALPPPWACFSLLLFASTPILIHYIPTAKVDTPALFFLLIAALLLFHDIPAPFSIGGAAVAIFLACGTRYNFVPFFALFIPVYGAYLYLFHRQLLPLFLKKIGATGLLSVFGLGIVSLIRPDTANGLLMSLRQLYEYNWSLSSWDTGRNYEFLTSMFPLPLLAFSAIGLGKKPDHTRAFLIIWSTSFFICHTYFLPGREARFLFPLLPPLAVLATLGMQTAFTRLSKKKAIFLACVLTLLFVVRATRECALFLDPFYREPFDQNVAQVVQSLSKENEVVWIGPSVGRHPNYFRYGSDQLAYLYHFHPLSVFFHLRRPVKQLFNGDILKRETIEQGYWLKNIGRATEDGTVFIVNSGPETHFTHLATADAKPIVIQRSRLVPYHVGKWDLPDGDYEAYVSKDGKRNAVGIYQLRKGKLRGWNGKPPECLLYFDKITVLWTT